MAMSRSTRRGPTSCAASGGRAKRRPHTNARSRSPRRARSATISPDASVTDNPAVPDGQPQFVHFDDVKAFELAAGVTGRPLFGAGAMINLIELKPGSVVPLHSHPHEQLGIVLRGMQALVIDGQAHELGPLEGYVLPGGVEHSAYCGPEGALVVDIFQPVREDYLARWNALP